MKKMKFFLLILLLSLNSIAEEIRPTPPVGWLELNSTSPVILTWVKSDLDKPLNDLPSLMIQELPLNEKFLSFIKEEKLDQSSCRIIKNENSKKWSQLWCLRSKVILVLMRKNSDSTINAPHETLKKWILSHE